MLPYDSHAVDTYAPTLHQPPAQARPPVVMEMDFPFLEENFRLFPSAEPTPQRTESITLKTSKINLKHIFVMLTMIKDILSEWHENAERLPQFLNIIDTNYLGILPKSFVMAWQQKPYQNKKPFEIVQHLCLIMLHLLASYETHNENEQKRIKKLIDGLSIINGIASSKAKYRLQRDTIKAFANQFGEWAFEEIMNSPHQQMFGISLFLYPKSLLQPTPASSHAKTIICLVKILRTVFNIPYDSKINEKREASEELPAAASSIRKRAHLPQPGSESNEEIVLNALPRPI